MSRSICFLLLFLILVHSSCTKKESIDLNTTTQEVAVHPGMDYYVDQTQGKWIWQLYLEFDKELSNVSGDATIEFVTYVRKKHDKKQSVKFNWSIPSTSNTANFVYTTNWTSYDFDDVDSISLTSIHCTSSKYHFKIK